MLGRRTLLQVPLAGALAGCATGEQAPALDGPKLVPIRARTDRLIDISVCLRPFRPAGPRVEPERFGNTLVVHNYGHGGSGWSLSWGSSAKAVRLAMESGAREIAVLGCGALGLTSAVLAQRAGARVTIYARDKLPLTVSAGATGEWTPDSRVAAVGSAAPTFAEEWEAMARASFKIHREYLGLGDSPVEWIDQFSLTAETQSAELAEACAVRFANYSSRIRDITPVWRRVPIEATPFKGASAARSEIVIFNIAGYAHTLMNDFLIAGGQYRRAEFQSPAQVMALPQKTVINCTGLGAKALFKDDTVVPIRGQIARLIPQPEVRYGLTYRHILTVPRRDGMVVQSFAGGALQGYDSTDETPDRAESETAVRTLAEAFTTKV